MSRFEDFYNERPIIKQNADTISRKGWDGLSSEVFQKLLDKASDSIDVIDPETLRFIYANEATLKMHGYERDEFLSLSIRDIDPHLGTEMLEDINRALQEKRKVLFESAHCRKDGSSFPVEVHISLVRIDGKDWRLAVVRDIAERKRINARMELFNTLLDRTSDAIEVIDPESLRYLDVNEAACRVLGYTRDELLKLSVWDIDPGMEFVPLNEVNQALENGQVLTHESFHRRKDGSIFPVEVVISQIQLDKTYNIAVARDITERKQSEQERYNLLQDIRRNASQLETIFATQSDVILVYDLNLKVVRNTLQFEKEYGFDPIGISLIEILQRVSCRTIDNQPVKLDDDLPTYRALQGETVHAAPYRVSRKDGSEVIVEASSTPINMDEKIQGVVSVWHDITQLTNALESLTDYARQLETAMNGTLKAMSRMVEQKDPYTAGHEQRVGIIAADIAREMGWNEQKCKELEMIGLIHDLGKIGIPSEILSKPSKLTETEFDLVKRHVDKGNEVLKDISFPFPVAEIVYQHHERLNGSGYPRGLKGDQILIEAKILAVADVLESMAAHRPYRPALGVEMAIQELTRNRGELYDPIVVDTLVKLFEEKNYQLPQYK